MPRLSPEELKKVRKKKQKERKETEKREREEWETEQREREAEKVKASTQQTRSEQLISVSNALYEEMDKLNRKAPAMEISTLSLDRINKVIKSVKELMKDEEDDFIEEISEFVPAGDMPEYRDVVLVLSQLKAGLDRFCASYRKYWYDLGI